MITRAMSMWTRPFVVAAMLILVTITFSSTSHISSPEPIPLDPEQVSFSNVTWDAGLKDVNGNFLAWGDYNNDGYQDLLVNGARLFENSGPPSWTFTEVSGQVGISGGSYGTWADWNNDGYLDIFVAGTDKLYRNNGPPDYTFSDVTSESGIMKESHSTGSGWGDYDNDGDLDLFKIRGEDWENSLYFPNSFWRNNGDGTFTNVSEEAGVYEVSDPKYSRGVTWCDYNFDGWMDVYISNYRQLDNYLYENNGDGTFTDVAPEKGVADGPPHGEGGNVDPYDRAGHGVGSIWGDYDNDGYFDLWVTNLNHKDARTSDDSLLYHSNGAPDYTFSNVRDQSGIHIKPYVVPNEGDELFVGCAWGDYDNDGDIDLYLPQIYDIDYAYSFLYSNNGDGTFTDVTVEADVRVWDTYAGCWADYDNDGDLDLVTSGRDGGGEDPVRPHFVHLFRNDGTSGSWLHLDITGNGDSSNRGGIGTRVKVTTESGDSQIKQVEGGMGPHGMQDSLVLEFGFGEYTGTVDMEITWTGGLVQNLQGISLNQRLTVEEPLPDIEVSDIQNLDPNPIEGEGVHLQAHITNIADIGAASTNVTFYLGSPANNVIIGGPFQLDELVPGTPYPVDCLWDTTGHSGHRTVYVRVDETVPAEDNLNNNEDSIGITVRTHNEPPVAHLTSDLDEIIEGESVTFDASDSTDDSMVLWYNFDFGDGTTTDWIEETMVNHTYRTADTYAASVMVSDDDGAESSLAGLEIKVSGPPTAHLSASPTSVLVGEAVTFDGSGSSDDGTVVSYLFDFGDDEHSGWISNSVTTHTYDEKGDYTVSLSVRDDEGLESPIQAHVSITVAETPNLQPIAFIDSISPNPATRGNTVTLTGHGQDDDGTITAYLWESSIDGELATDSSFSLSSLSVGYHIISFSVLDDDGEWSSPATRDLTIKVENALPEVTIVSLEDYEKVSGEVVISGVADDDDGSVEHVEVRVDEGTWERAQGTTAWSFTLNTSDLTQGEHVISVRAFDGEEYSEVTTINVIVVLDDDGDDGGTDPMLIIAAVMGFAGIVAVLVATLGKYMKKENQQHPPPSQVQFMHSPKEPQQEPTTRWNW